MCRITECSTNKTVSCAAPPTDEAALPKGDGLDYTSCGIAHVSSCWVSSCIWREMRNVANGTERQGERYWFLCF